MNRTHHTPLTFVNFCKPEERAGTYRFYFQDGQITGFGLNGLLESHILHMVADEHRHIVTGGIPPRFAGHVVTDMAAVDLEPLKGNASDLSLLVVSVDDR